MAMRSTGRRRNLRILSPDFIGKATDETATQVTRIGLTFLGTTAFCLLSLFSSDSALLFGKEKINVPGAGPVSFGGFMLVGPVVLIVLRIYLQIYVEHSERLERLARSMSIARAPMLVPLQNPLIRYFSGLIFYLLLPLTMLLFAWKAAVFPAWGSGLLGVAVAVVASHLMLPLKKFSWRSKVLLSTGAAIVVAATMFGIGLVRRPVDLSNADLSGKWLFRMDLRNADLTSANLSHADLSRADLSRANLRFAILSSANLSGANLSGAYLSRANLTGANLTGANLTGADLRLDANLSRTDLTGANLTGADLSGVADLTGANLTGANLSGAYLSRAYLRRNNLTGANLSGVSRADLSGADLSGADLGGAKDLTQEQLDKACGNADTKLPEGLTLKLCDSGPVP
jgi:uncharacterized protein YjbI with pentapeptide repeats